MSPSTTEFQVVGDDGAYVGLEVDHPTTDEDAARRLLDRWAGRGVYDRVRLQSRQVGAWADVEIRDGDAIAPSTTTANIRRV